MLRGASLQAPRSRAVTEPPAVARCLQPPVTGLCGKAYLPTLILLGMRRRTATGWRRWALGAGSGLILCVATGIGATAVARASALNSAGAASSGALLSSSFDGMPSTAPTVLNPILPSLPVPTSSLPVLGGGPTPCAVNCSPDPCTTCGGNHTPSGPNDPASTTTVVAPGSTATPTVGAASGGGRVGGPRGTTPAGLNIGPPPSVLALGPVSPVGLGSAPFLWPLFAALDVLGLVAVVTVVRKTWSRTAAD
jgi:hypothetical protein